MKKVIPKKSYFNINKNKNNILKENSNKAGIYRWNNLITGKSYIGSAKCLKKRLNSYCSFNYLKIQLNRGSSAIYSALLKYGYSKFNLDILEYCNEDILIEREQYYIDLLNPEYNILKLAGSRLGVKLSEKTKELISIKLRGCKYIKKTKNKLTKEIKDKYFSTETLLKLSSNSKGVKVKIFDSSNNLVKEFPTITMAAKFFGVTKKTISRISNRKNSYYKFTFKFEIKNNKIWVCNHNNELIERFNSIKETSQHLNIPATTLSRYLKNNKLYKNKFFFYNK